MANHKALVNIIGKMVVTLKVNLKMDFVMVMEFGNVIMEIVINIKVNIKMIKNKDMEYLIGQLEMFIKVNNEK
jgi:hypothetical protein